ncbi:MAG: ribosome silencing factor, partial [Planctomycetia bacterium]|nr:ribosome silencing factor [Planctomycetia bacterium]
PLLHADIVWIKDQKMTMEQESKRETDRGTTEASDNVAVGKSDGERTGTEECGGTGTPENVVRETRETSDGGTGTTAQSATFEMGTRRGDGLQRAMAALKVARENRAKDPTLLDTRNVTAVFDYFLIVTGASRRQVYAIAEEIHHEMRKVWNDRRIGFEGAEDCRWIILDYGDLVIHVFDEETREYYRLEDLWAGAQNVDLSGADETRETDEGKPATTVERPMETEITAQKSPEMTTSSEVGNSSDITPREPDQSTNR